MSELPFRQRQSARYKRRCHHRIGRQHVHKIIYILVMCALATAACADTLRLSDGRVFEGTIVEQTRSKIVFDAVISNITTRMNFKARDIESITLGTPATEPATAAPARKSKTLSPQAFNQEQTRYLVVPITGTFGEQVGPTGVANIFEYAQRRDIEHLVFYIDSPGGYIWAADEISTVMAARPDSITCYAVIDNAISAAIWVAFSCDRIFIRSGGTIGGAVAYTQDSTTGAAEVDAKMNSILAAKLAGMCSTNGHPEALARAMVVMEESLYATTTDDGSYTLSNQGTSSDRQLDDGTTVLTLTGTQVESFGIGTIFDGDISALGTQLGIEDWTLASDFGAAAMQRGQRDLKKRADLIASHQRIAAKLERAIEQVNLSNPNGPTYMVHEGGAMTSASIKMWRERTDACIKACRDMVQLIQELESLHRKASKIGIQELNDSVNLEELREDAENRLDDLRKNRNKTTF